MFEFKNFYLQIHPKIPNLQMILDDFFSIRYPRMNTTPSITKPLKNPWI